METHQTSIYKKILAVMSAVDRVQKDKRNDFHKYNYVSDEAIVGEVRKEIINQHLVVMPSQKSCTLTGDMTTLEVEYTMIDTDSGESVTSRVFGYGQDKGDKGVYKAATGAEKYFLLKTFMIPTGDDPEVDSHDVSIKSVPADMPYKGQIKTITEKQRARLYAIWKQAGKSDAEVKLHINNEYGFESTKDITMDAYEAIVAWCQGTDAQA